MAVVGIVFAGEGRVMTPIPTKGSAKAKKERTMQNRNKRQIFLAQVVEHWLPASPAPTVERVHIYLKYGARPAVRGTSPE